MRHRKQFFNKFEWRIYYYIFLLSSHVPLRFFASFPRSYNRSHSYFVIHFYCYIFVLFMLFLLIKNLWVRLHTHMHCIRERLLFVNRYPHRVNERVETRWFWSLISSLSVYFQLLFVFIIIVAFRWKLKSFSALSSSRHKTIEIVCVYLFVFESAYMLSA